MKKSFKDMTHEEKMEQARLADIEFAKKKDPFVEGERKYGSKNKMFKDSMKDLDKKLKKKK